MRFAIIFLFLSAATSHAFAQDPVGAKEAIKVIREKSRKQDSQPKARAKQSALAKALAAYKEKLPNLTPEQAAAQWLALVDLSHKAVASENEDMMFEMMSDNDHSPWGRVMGVLPGPDVWPALARQIEARELPKKIPEQLDARGLRLLGFRLSGKFDALETELLAIEKLLSDPTAKKTKPADGERAVVGKILNLLKRSRGRSVKFTQVFNVIAQLRASLGRDDPVATFERLATSESIDRRQGANVPDLVGLVGRDRASELLLKAFQKKKLLLTFSNRPAETLNLARQLALANIDSLASPQWGLCKSTETAKLFEAMLDRFAGKKESDSNGFSYHDKRAYSEAASFYFRGLILRGEDDAATRLFVEQAAAGSQSPIDLFDTWRNVKTSRENRLKIFQFLLSLAKNHPEFKVWGPLVTTGAQLSRGAEVLQLIDEISARPDLANATRQDLRDVRAGVLLASGKIDDAIQQFRQNLRALADHKGEAERDKYAAIALKMIDIGRLMKRPEWSDEGFANVERLFSTSVEKYPSAENMTMDHTSISILQIYLKELVRRERVKDAESLLIEMLAAQQRKESRVYSYNEDAPGVLLAELYLDAGRPEDVITLLDEATWWEQDDLSAATSMGYGKSLAFVAAKAFMETGQRNVARKLLQRLVYANPSVDAVWAELLKVEEDGFPEIANSVFKRDRFEERPLIWLARYQLDAGNGKAAEKTIRRAISIDPSDGEQGKGDRMRAYAVLADVLAAKGDPQAEVFRGAVRAIRMAENADDFLTAGMYSLAVERYNASLEQFADAYCIQSRLAVQLAEHGDLEGAARHYKRAFELMPDSFGRVESHCFGCEGTFNGELASSIAERVFARLAAERPQDPKVHYLLGYLHSSQLRVDEALKNYRAAVTLDPDYVNAWTKILELRNSTEMPTRLVDDAALNIYRLAPLGNRYGFGSEIRDLKRLWETVAEVERRIPQVELGPLYPLRAAAKARKTQQRQMGFGGFSMSMAEDDGGNSLSPNEALSSNNSIGFITQIIQFSNREALISGPY